MRVTSSNVFSPVRTRYVTETQSGACPASVATVRSRASTSLSSRGAMNSNETVGLLRASMSAIRIGSGTLPQYSGVSDAARHALRVEVLEQRQHGTAAGAHSVAKLRDRDRAVRGDQLPDQVDRGRVGITREGDIVAHPHDVPAL